jgi:hypothetical protein
MVPNPPLAVARARSRLRAAPFLRQSPVAAEARRHLLDHLTRT